jgi:ligand-binding SRPBCC domain-containing protein
LLETAATAKLAFQRCSASTFFSDFFRFFAFSIAIMRLLLSTRVRQHYKIVFSRFDRDLFLALAPPFPRVEIKRFDGCRQGDVVELELKLFGSKQQWTSHITEDGEVSGDAVYKDEVYFIDESSDAELPFFLRRWHHKHSIVRESETESFIVDDIEFEAAWGLDVVLYPLLWLQFAYRKPIYKRYFQ